MSGERELREDGQARIDEYEKLMEALQQTIEEQSQELEILTQKLATLSTIPANAGDQTLRVRRGSNDADSTMAPSSSVDVNLANNVHDPWTGGTTATVTSPAIQAEEYETSIRLLHEKIEAQSQEIFMLSHRLEEAAAAAAAIQQVPSVSPAEQYNDDLKREVEGLRRMIEDMHKKEEEEEEAKEAELIRLKGELLKARASHQEAVSKMRLVLVREGRARPMIALYVFLQRISKQQDDSGINRHHVIFPWLHLNLSLKLLLFVWK